MSMRVSPVEHPSKAHRKRLTSKGQLLRLLYFLIDHLKFFLIGCVAIVERRRGADVVSLPVFKSPGGSF